jgi:hypothetical protein
MATREPIGNYPELMLLLLRHRPRPAVRDLGQVARPRPIEKVAVASATVASRSPLAPAA